MRIIAFLLVVLAVVVPCEAVRCLRDPCTIEPAINTCVPQACRQNYTIGCNYYCYNQLEQSLAGLKIAIASTSVTSTTYTLGGRINTTLQHAYAFVPDDEVGSTTYYENSTTWETTFDVNEVQRMIQGGSTFIGINARNGKKVTAKVDIRVAAPMEAVIGTTVDPQPILFDSIFQAYIVNGEPVVRITGRWTGTGNLVKTDVTPSGAIVGPDPKPRYMGIVTGSRTFTIDYPLQVVAQAILNGKQVGVVLTSGRDDFSGEFYPELKVINLQLTTQDAYDTWPAATCTNQITQCINANKNDTSSCGDAYHVSRCPLKCRTNEGSYVSMFEKYRYKCNTCDCSANGEPGICTKMGCPSTCYDNNGKGYGEGETRKQDCNTCTCSQDGNWACTKMLCPTTPEPGMCIQGGPVPDVCSEEGQYHWDSKTCRFICNQPVNCLIDPCDNAVRDGVCTREACVADYWTGCNFICNANTTAPTCGERGLGCSVVDCGNNRACDEDPVTCTATCKPIPTPTPTTGGVLCPQVCKPMSCPGYEEIVRVCTIKVINNACTWVCPAPPTTKPTTKPPVNCIIDPCVNAVRDGLCTREACVADYSIGCNFICKANTTKPTTTPEPPVCTSCAAMLCATGTFCTETNGCGKCEPRMCIQGGAPPASCSQEGQYQWDNIACRWRCKCRTNEGNFVSVGDEYRYKCNTCTCGENGEASVCTRIGCQQTCYDDKGNGYNKGETMKQDCNTCTCGADGNWACTEKSCTTEPPVCASCAATSCLKGTTCIENNGCATCEPNVCEDKCALVRCTSGTTCVQDSYPSCEARCVPSAPVVLTLSFTLRFNGYSTKPAIHTEMYKIARKARVANQFVIHDDDIIQLYGYGYYGSRWSIKVGFKGQTYVDRVFALLSFFIELNQKYDADAVRINAATTTWGFTNEDTITTATETMSMQTCADGSEMSVEQQCPMVDDLIVPTSTSSSSSTPIAVIIAPIVAGIVLITVIATAIIIIRRRRLNTIKTMDRMETQMTPNPAITSQV